MSKDLDVIPEEVTDMRADQLFLDPTSRVISVEDEDFDGRLGFLILDRSVEQIVALTASQLASAGLVINESKQAAARASSNRKLSDYRMEKRPADTMLMPVILENTVGLSEVQLRDVDGEPIMPTNWVRDIATVLGETVLVHTSKEDPKLARVTTTNGHFIMPVDDGNEVHFSNALELQSLDGTPVTEAGDAGCLVTSLSGDAIGIIICGMDDISYAAPIARLIDELEDCDGITHQMIENAKSLRAEQLAKTKTTPADEIFAVDEELEELLAEHRDAGTLDEVDPETAQRLKEGMF